MWLLALQSIGVLFHSHEHPEVIGETVIDHQQPLSTPTHISIPVIPCFPVFLCLPMCVTCSFLANVVDFARAVVKKRGDPPDNYSQIILDFLHDHRPPDEAKQITVSGVLFYFADSTLSMQDLYDVMMELFPKRKKHILALIQ